MLSHIHICNLGIINDVEINFEKGFNVMTGETGAGKTLIIGAISMILGNKVSRDNIRTGEEKAFVEALFYIDDEELRSALALLGYDEDEIVIYREISLSGRSMAKINGRMVTVNELKEVGSLLVDLHGQHDNQFLLNAKNHIGVLDNFAGARLKNVKDNYLKFYEDRKDILEKIDKMGGNPEQRARTIEFLKFQIDEIEAAKLKENEDEELNERRKILASSEKVLNSLSFCADSITDERGVLSILQHAIRRINEIEDINPEYKKLGEIIQEAYYQIEEAGYSINSEKDKVYIDEDELNQIEERIDLISRLKKKYGGSVKDILSTYEQLDSEYKELLNSESILEELQFKLNETESKMKELACKINDIRNEVGKDLEKKLADILTELEMPKAHFEIKVDPTDIFLKNGMDSVEILFSSNLGENVKELSKTASGGEISRIMLALKNVLVNADIIPVMIFDEIDTGISGKAGNAVGEKMLEISKDKQVICVTHLPSIAAKGTSNFFISKNVVENKTMTSVKRLNENETISEIARIIGGGDISDIALQHAREIRTRPIHM